MCTSSVKVIRYDCRYYVYHNYLDGHVEHVGAEIVSMIPSDPGEYRSEWHHS